MDASSYEGISAVGIPKRQDFFEASGLRTRHCGLSGCGASDAALGDLEGVFGYFGFLGFVRAVELSQPTLESDT